MNIPLYDDLHHDLLRRVTPQTRAIIWIPSEASLKGTLKETLKAPLKESPFFCFLDYLFDGLLQQSLMSAEKPQGPTSLLVGESFGKKLYLFIMPTSLDHPHFSKKLPKEILSFTELLKRELGEESYIALLDSSHQFKNFQSYFQELLPNIKKIDERATLP